MTDYIGVMYVCIIKLKKSLISYAALTLFSALLLCASPAEAKAPKGFAEPIRLRAGDGFMKAERGYATPCLADIHGDGINDIISGCYVADEEREKGIAFQYVIAGKADGSFEKATPIKASDGKPLILPGINRDDRYDRSRICTHPFACDWDGDGDLDLLVGNFQGTFYLAENIGSATSPSWKSQGEWIKGGDGQLLGRGQKKISKVHLS